MEVPRQKRKYEKKQKVLPLSSGAPHHQGPVVFNAKDLNQYDFPSSDDEPFSQVAAAPTPPSPPQWRVLALTGMGSNLECLCSQLHSGSSEAEEENDPDGVYAFRRKAGCQYYAVSGRSRCGVIDTNGVLVVEALASGGTRLTVRNAVFLPAASSGLRGELALVWPRGGRSC